MPGVPGFCRAAGLTAAAPGVWGTCHFRAVGATGLIRRFGGIFLRPFCIFLVGCIMALAGRAAPGTPRAPRIPRPGFIWFTWARGIFTLRFLKVGAFLMALALSTLGRARLALAMRMFRARTPRGIRCRFAMAGGTMFRR